MKTLRDALLAGETLADAPMVRTERGVVRHRCQAQRCRVWRPAFALRDVRESPAFGDAGFVCDECEGRVRRAFAVLFGVFAPGAAP